MVQLFSACPYTFYWGRRRFVLCQFRTRYCGHTLSRLAGINHNMTKQTGFPTIRRKGSEESEYNSGLVWFWTSAGIGLSLRKGWNKFSRPLWTGVGWLVLCWINDTSPVITDRICWFGMDILLSQKLKLRAVVDTSRAHKSFLLLLAKSEGCGLLADGQACCV